MAERTKDVETLLGNPKKAMGLTLFTVIFNTILDPIFIFWLDLGIAGAAWATVISQTIAMLVVMGHFNNRSRAVHLYLLPLPA